VPSISVGSARFATAALRVFRASGLNLLVAAHHPLEHEVPRGGLTRSLRRQGGTINEDLLRHVAPLGWEHIGLTGDYVWSTADQPPAGTLRPLRQRQSLLAA
jgi:hypothetical protein